MMPVILSTNRLLTWACGLFAAYWALGFVSDHLWFSVVVSACLFVGGIMVAARAVPDAIQIVRKDQVGPGELAVIALALLAVGAVWTGAFNMFYYNYGRPISWIGPISSFGRAMIGTGFFILFLSPDATRQGIRWPRWYMLIGSGIIIAVVSFLIGYTMSRGDTEMSDLFETSRGRLPPSFVVKPA